MNKTVFTFALDIFKANFIPLFITISVFLIPIFLFLWIFATSFPQLPFDSNWRALGYLLIIMFIVPFIHGGTAYLLYKILRRETWQISFVLLSGVKFWYRLLLSNMLRFLFFISAIVVFGGYFSPQSPGDDMLLIFQFLFMLFVL